MKKINNDNKEMANHPFSDCSINGKKNMSQEEFSKLLKDKTEIFFGPSYNKRSKLSEQERITQINELRSGKIKFDKKA